MKLLKCIGALVMLLINVVMTLVGLSLNVALMFFGILAGAYMRT